MSVSTVNLSPVDSTGRPSRVRSLARTAVAVSAVALFIAGMGATASAEPGVTDGGEAVATVAISSTITFAFTGDTEDLDFGTSVPGAVLTGAVTYNVITNNSLGYSVTVAADAPAFVAATPATGNTDTFPISALTVLPNATTAVPVPAAIPLTEAAQVIHTQTGPTDDDGNDLSNAYSLTVPTVNADTYTLTLNYLATTL